MPAVAPFPKALIKKDIQLVRCKSQRGQAPQHGCADASA
jgi:hypothetical protein